MAASSPSEYEKPPTGKAGEASQISCSRGVSSGMRGRGMLVAVVMAVVMVVAV